jgi:hypothetical protein
MSSQGVTSSEQASNNPGLCPIKGRNRALPARLNSSSHTYDYKIYGRNLAVTSCVYERHIRIKLLHCVEVLFKAISD